MRFPVPDEKVPWEVGAQAVGLEEDGKWEGEQSHCCSEREMYHAWELLFSPALGDTASAQCTGAGSPMHRGSRHGQRCFPGKTLWLCSVKQDWVSCGDVWRCSEWTGTSGLPVGLTQPYALQVDFQLYDPPAYSADHRDTAVQDPFSP